jgi:hypothetical protein
MAQTGGRLRRRLRSRAEEHAAIDELAYEPGRESERVPLTPKKRQDLHAAADARWDALKKAGTERIRATREELASTEDKIIAGYQLMTDRLTAALDFLKDGDLSIELGDELVEASERSTPGMRKLEASLDARREAAGDLDGDPETYEFDRFSEVYDAFPALKTKDHPTEVEW